MDRIELRAFRAERGLATVQALSEIVQDAGALAAQLEAAEMRVRQLQSEQATLATALKAATDEIAALRATQPTTT